MTRKLTISLIALLLVAILRPPARADDRTMIAAATANAIDSLREDVAAARIDNQFSVAEFLSQAGGNTELMQTLERAEQIGGPRFSADGEACQIQLQISGPRVAHALITIAASRPNRSPLPAEVLARILENWRDTVFTGTGSSISGSKVQFVRPSGDDAWADVGDAARKQAVDAARDDAVRRAMDSVQPILLAGGRTVGDTMAITSFRESLASWLASRPVRRVRFEADHEVELTLSTPPSELCDEVISLARTAQVPLPDSQGEAALYDRFSQLPPVSIGRATASSAPPTTAGPTLDLPTQPPAWTEQPLMAEGTADGRGSKLKTARVAESAAEEALRVTVNALPLTSNMTVGDAARKSPVIAQAVARCLADARPYKVEYRADGSVSVKSSLNPRELWAAVSGQQ